MTTEMTYRKTYAAGASPIGMMIALFDTLVGNFSRAADNIREGDIESRCKELSHATLVLGQLENWLDLEGGGDSAQNLARFYAFLRSRMLEASARLSPELLEEQIDTILHIRSAWQQLDELQPVANEPDAPAARLAYEQPHDSSAERVSFSLSV